MKPRLPSSSASSSRGPAAPLLARIGFAAAAMVLAPVVGVVPALAQSDQERQPRAQAQQPDRGQPAPGAVANDLHALSADDTQWVMAPKNYASTRFSELDEIDAGNVRDLAVAFTFSTGVERGHEAAPAVDEVVGNDR